MKFILIRAKFRYHSTVVKAVYLYAADNNYERTFATEKKERKIPGFENAPVNYFTTSVAGKLLFPPKV